MSFHIDMIDNNFSERLEKGERWEERVSNWFYKKGFICERNIFDNGDGQTTQYKVVNGSNFLFPDLTIIDTGDRKVLFYVEVKSFKKLYTNDWGLLDRTRIKSNSQYVFIEKRPFDLYLKFQKHFKRKVVISFIVGSESGWRRKSFLYSASLNALDKKKILIKKSLPYGKRTKGGAKDRYFFNINMFREEFW